MKCTTYFVTLKMQAHYDTRDCASEQDPCLHCFEDFFKRMFSFQTEEYHDLNSTTVQWSYFAKGQGAPAEAVRARARRDDCDLESPCSSRCLESLHAKSSLLSAVASGSNDSARSGPRWHFPNRPQRRTRKRAGLEAPGNRARNSPAPLRRLAWSS